jgi:16S rRNA (uracil1498-N3)-methyltransferase
MSRMNVPYFYEPTLVAQTTTHILSEETSKHCIQVLRMKEGDRIDLTNGHGNLFEAIITVAHKKNSTVQIQSQKFIERSQQQIILGISLLKNATRLEWLFEKATEMGIHTIVPLICERTIHERFKMDRMQNILQSAMIQSQQTWLPIVTMPIAYDIFLKNYKAAQQLIAHCEPTDKINIKELTPSNDCLLLIGPEGDFSLNEIKKAIDHNYDAIHLGPTRLRTETAGIFALSVLKKIKLPSCK